MIGEPFYVPGEIDNGGVESKRAELQKKLDDLVAKGKEWRNGG
jgi:hypothetical protein